MSEIQLASAQELTQVSNELGFETEGDEVFRSTSKERLPFAFAHRHQVILAHSEQGTLSVFYTAKTPLFAMLEARRYCGAELGLVQLEAAKFEA
ncbi:MAG: type II secretion system protein GspE, partial [Shewanella sp.]